MQYYKRSLMLLLSSRAIEFKGDFILRVCLNEQLAVPLSYPPSSTAEYIIAMVCLLTALRNSLKGISCWYWFSKLIPLIR